MKYFAAACAATCLFASVAQASIIVDGGYDADYGAATALVTYDATAPNSNFGAPTDKSDAIGYSIFLRNDGGFLYGYLQASGLRAAGAPIFTGANLYFDLDSATRSGSDLGFELGVASQTVFIPGGSGPQAIGNVVTAASADGLGFEFKMPETHFTSQFLGLAYDPALTMPGPGDLVRLNLSQSFGYSVAGGQSFYGTGRLGTFNISGAVPEPATWMMMLVGFAAVGGAMRRSRKAGTLATA